jgi:putative transposase
VNRKRVCRLMNLMGIEAIYPKKKKLSNPGQESANVKFPYLLRDLSIDRVNYVWVCSVRILPISR